MAWLKDVLERVRSTGRSLSVNCREASRLQAEAAHRPLTSSERFGLRAHLCLCGWCRRFARQLGFLRQAATPDTRPNGETPAAQLDPEAKAKLKQSLRGSADASPASRDPR